MGLERVLEQVLLQATSCQKVRQRQLVQSWELLHLLMGQVLVLGLVSLQAVSCQKVRLKRLVRL